MIASKLICKSNFYGHQIPTAINKIPRKFTPLRKSVVMKTGDLSSLASSYASALINLSSENNSLEKVNTDMNALDLFLKKDTNLKEFLINPVVSEIKKFKILDIICEQEEFSKYSANFLKLLVQKGRMENIQEILEAFDLEYCRVTDTQVAVLKSAIKMQADQQMSLAKKVKDLCGSKNIKLNEEIDESLIGGFVIEYGSNQIDLSIKGQLEQITNDLNQLAATGKLF